MRPQLPVLCLFAGFWFSHWLSAQDTIIDTEPGVVTTSPVTFQTLSDNQAKDQSDKRSYLESNGWAYNCDNPGSLWLWAKVIDGKEYRLGFDDAVAIQVQAENL